MEQLNKNIFDYIEIFYRRKWTLIILALLGTGIGALISLSLPSYYLSTALIMVEQQQVPERYVTPTDTTPIAQRLNTITQQIMSRTNLEQIIKDLNLYEENAKQTLSDSFLLTLKRIIIGGPAKATKETIMEQMKKDIEVEVIRDSGGKRDSGGRGGATFRVSYTGRDPFVTMQITNRFASLFIEENLKIREEYIEGTSEFLTGEIEKAKAELERQEAAIRAFKEKYMGSLPEQLEANLRTLDRLQLELQSIETSLKNAEDRRIFLEEQLGLITPGSTTAITGPIVDPLEIELTRLKNELASLLSTYKENYPDVVLTRNRIKEIEKMLAGAKKTNSQKPGEQVRIEPGSRTAGLYTDLMTLKSEITTLKKREIDIRKQIKIYEKRIEDIPANEQKLTDLRRDYDISLQSYRALLGKKLDAGVAENLEKRQKGERFRIIDPANLPEKPYKPERLKIILVGMMAGTGVGMGIIFLIEFLNPAFRRPEDFTGVLTPPVLAAIPKFTLKTTKKPEKKFMVLRGRKR